MKILASTTVGRSRWTVELTEADSVGVHPYVSVRNSAPSAKHPPRLPRALFESYAATAVALAIYNERKRMRDLLGL